MSDVVASDPKTLVIRWSSLNPDAGAIISEELDPLPRHILGPAFNALRQDATSREQFLGLRYWTSEYLGAGPFRLDNWVPGTQLEGSAFAGHALGRPRIERILVRIIADENTALTNVLAGGVDYSVQTTLRFEHAQVLQREWVPAGKGGVILRPGAGVIYQVQLRPEYAAHPGQLDLRVRKALAHGIDRQALNEGLFDGQGFMSETYVPISSPFLPEVNRVIARYPYDPRRAEQLMTEAGYRKDRDGMFEMAGERFQSDLRVTTGPEFERGQAILASTWQHVGFPFTSSLVPTTQVPTAEERHTFPGLAFRGSTSAERLSLTSEIGSPSNRWFGENRGGWSNPEYDRLYESFALSLDPTERTRTYGQLIRLLTEGLPFYITHFSLYVSTHSASLHGPAADTVGSSGERGTLPHWNIHEWELR
jgi:peptide/nickel transport system substrate-binding protein